MSMGDAIFTVKKLGKKIDNIQGGSVAILHCTTDDPELVGASVNAYNRWLNFMGTIDENGTCNIEVPYVGVYDVRCGNDILQTGIVSELGQIVDVELVPYHVYGYRKRKADSNSYARLDYIDEAVGFKPLTRNFSTDDTDMGDWEDTFIFKAFRPLMLQSNGEVLYELDHNDQTLRIDGVTASDISNTSVDADAMVGVKTLWLYRHEDELFEYVHIASAKVNENYKAYVHTSDDGETILDEVYLPMFEGSSVSGKVRSLAGQTPMNNQPGATEQTQIEAKGAGWQFDDHANRELVRDVLTLFCKSTNGDAVYGAGHNTGGSSASSLLQTGTKKNKGAFSCSNNNDAVKVLWLENYWGDRWDRCYGAIYDTAGVLKIKMHPPYNTTGLGYENTGVTIGGTSGGYISETKMTEYGMLPVTVSGSETTYEADGCWFNTTRSNFLLRGGDCNYGALCGFSCWNVNNLFSDASWIIGPSLSYKKPAAA